MSIVNNPFLDQPTATIMLLGVFHFQDRGRDRHKPQHGFDVLSDRRQREVVDLVERLAVFQATTVLPDERILLIIGSGHVPILRHCVLASPEYALAEVHEYLTR
jgi:hypothetical protein